MEERMGRKKPKREKEEALKEEYYKNPQKRRVGLKNGSTKCPTRSKGPI